MPTRAQVAILLTALMCSSGCMGLFEPSEELPDILDCAEQPNHPDCIVDPVTEEDCRQDEVFTGDECRRMERPEQLSYGISSISLNVGEEMQALTPSFVGDGPDTWVINPPFPQGISFDRESGVISGSPSEATIEIRHTIVASNAVGSTSTWIDLEVTIEGPKSITYAESILDCELGHQCQLAAPSISGGEPDYWSVDPRLPDGISLLPDGSIDGSPTQLGDSNHTITISNEGGSVETAIRIIVLHEAPMGLGYGGNRFILSIGDDVQVVPITTGGRIVSWSVEPPLPDGLQLLQADGSIRGSPTTVQSLTPHRVTATNTGGSISVDVLISVVDIPVSNLIYTPDEYDLTIGDEISVTPTHSGGIPDSWQVEPELPSGFTFDSTNGTISGTATDLQVDWSSFTIWANNTGGSASTSFRIRITSLAPDLISWAQTEYALASNESAFIAVTNNGPAIDSWEIEPALPDGLVIIANGSIEGTPTHNIDWTEFTIWANNTGGSVGLNIWIVVHDLRADQSELLSGLDDADWGGWSSLILPIGKWSFPLGRDTTDSTVVAASHVGRGKMIGLGHESWVTQNHEFNFRAVEWVCGEAANVGLAYGAGFDHWEDELQAEGYSVHLSVTPDDLSQVDCLLDEFWNGHDDDDNLAIEQFLLGGGGVIMGGHAWYWSYSNSDVPHNYPGNKISKITGLMVSSDWGYNDIDFEIPDLMYTPHNAIRGIFADRVDGIELTEEEAAIAYSSISDCTVIVPLDFLEFWTPLRKLVNSTGWTVIPYSTLWSSTGHELGADPVADVILRLEEALTQNLPADELPVHPSHTEFPGEVPSNATRISRTVSINGTQPGLPSNFGYSGARSSLRMSTGLYAPPGEVITVSASQDVSELGFWILIGAHTDGLWGKDVIKRHSKIYRYWWIENTTTEIGNAFGGPIYAAIPAGSEFGEFDMTISGAVRAPMFVLGETSDFEWIYSERDNPAPWTELVSNNFIMTVPSSEIRNLNNPTELMDWWDQALEMEHELYGYLPWPRVERAVFDAQISAGWMHSGYPFMAHDLSVAGVVNSSYMSENGDWGMFHELGHNHQWMPSTLPGTTETGCNFASVYLMEELVGVEGHGAVDPAQRESRMRNYFDDGSNIANWSVWIALDTYLIIKEEWDWDPITEALSVYYTLPSAEVPVGDTEEFNAWVMHLSNATGYNLAPYHAAWGFPLTQDTFDSLSHLPIWVDDPLRGEYFVYDAMLRNIGANSTTSSTADFAWETYDNGTNTTLTLYWGTTDMGNQSWVWGNNANLGDSEVGWGEYEVTGLSSGTTYYARVKASNEERDTWFGPVSWTTST